MNKNSITKILIVEDEETCLDLLKKILEKENYTVESALNGSIAYNLLKENTYDLLLTDWMMPEMDGIELIRRVRNSIEYTPGIIVITGLTSHSALNYILNSGADDFITKPYRATEILKKISDLLFRISQQSNEKASIPEIILEQYPPFTGICIAASSGGPQTLLEIITSIPLLSDSAVFIVQHAPAWALEDMANSWNRSCRMHVKTGSDGEKIKPGIIYLAPGNFHMTVDDSFYIRLTDDPPENFVKPSADPLFLSVAKNFGELSIAVVLSGMGCDGAQGSQYIAAVNGIVIVQDPETSIVKAMPMAAIESVPFAKIIPIKNISGALSMYSSKQAKLIVK